MKFEFRDRVRVIDAHSPFHNWVGRVMHVNHPKGGYYVVSCWRVPDGWTGVSLTFSGKQLELVEKAD